MQHYSDYRLELLRLTVHHEQNSTFCHFGGNKNLKDWFALISFHFRRSDLGEGIHGSLHRQWLHARHAVEFSGHQVCLLVSACPTYPNMLNSQKACIKTSRTLFCKRNLCKTDLIIRILGPTLLLLILPHQICLRPSCWGLPKSPCAPQFSHFEVRHTMSWHDQMIHSESWPTIYKGPTCHKGPTKWLTNNTNRQDRPLRNVQKMHLQEVADSEWKPWVPFKVFNFTILVSLVETSWTHAMHLTQGVCTENHREELVDLISNTRVNVGQMHYPSCRSLEMRTKKVRL